MGFLRTNKDGTTSLAILCGNTGVMPGTNEQPISLGSLAGKLPHGTGQLAGFREDKRNVAKTGEEKIKILINSTIFTIITVCVCCCVYGIV